jgi:hypothetical protein
LGKQGHRTPVEVVQTIMNEVEEFDMDVNITKRALRLYPQLFEQPAAPEVGS